MSLQDPRVLVELQGINEERKSAERAGIKLIQAPMLPWVSDNSNSIAMIKVNGDEWPDRARRGQAIPATRR